MLGHQFAYSAAPVRKVKEVQFGILSPEEIVRRFSASISLPPLVGRVNNVLTKIVIVESLLGCQD